MNSEKRLWHRHRRSAAISGSFDATSLVASPPLIEVGNLTEFRSLQLQTSSKDEASLELKNELSYRERELVQAEDFCNCPSKESYSFPSKLQIRNERSVPAAPNSSLSKEVSSNAENSLQPRWEHVRETKTSTPTSTPRFFLTEETTLGEGNVPDAIIDLDSVSRVSQNCKKTSNSNVRLSSTENVLFDSFRIFDKSTSINSGHKNRLAHAGEGRKDLQAHTYDFEANCKGASNALRVIRQTSECYVEKEDAKYDLRNLYRNGRSTSQKFPAKSKLAGAAFFSGRQLDYTNSVGTINITLDKSRGLPVEPLAPKYERNNANQTSKSQETASDDEGSGSF